MYLVYKSNDNRYYVGTAGGRCSNLYYKRESAEELCDKMNLKDDLREMEISKTS